MSDVHEGDFDTPPPSHGSPVAALPQWRVVLHDDEINDRQYVIDALTHSLPVTPATATRRVMEAQQRGTAVILLTHRELAELYYVMLSKQNLIVSIEREIG